MKEPDSIGFIDAEGWNNMNYYANAKILTSRRVDVGINVIFDGDTDNENRNKKIKVRHLFQCREIESLILQLPFL